MYKFEKTGALFLIAIFAAFFYMTGNVNPKAQTYPYFVCSIGIFLTALHLGIVIYKEKKQIAIDVSAALTKTQFASVIITLAAAFFYIFLARYIGYFTMTFIYIAGFSYWQSSAQKKYMYPLVAFGMVIVIYFAFKVFLRVPLPTGMLI